MMLAFSAKWVALPDLHTAKAAIDGFAAASVLPGELRCGLFSCAIGCCPKLVILQALAAIELPAAVVAFVASSAITPPIFFDLF